jgi:multimeric flavodoxin WrbA
MRVPGFLLFQDKNICSRKSMRKLTDFHILMGHPAKNIPMEFLWHMRFPGKNLTFPVYYYIVHRYRSLWLQSEKNLKGRNQIMKIVILNGSPRPNGNTQILAEEFIRGAREAGHETELIHLREKKIAGCLGCQYCFSHEGECVQKDDMKEVLASLDQADMLVIASPIYWFDLTAQTKAAIDRMYARGKVGFHFHKTAMLLDSGSDHVYDAAIRMYQMMTGYLNWQDMGIITAPGMTEKGSMKHAPAMQQAYTLGKTL